MNKHATSTFSQSLISLYRVKKVDAYLATSFSVFPSTSDATAARSLRPYCSHPLTKLFRSFLVQLPKPCARSSSFSASSSSVS